MLNLIVVGHIAKNNLKVGEIETSYWGGAGYHVAWSAGIVSPKETVGLISAVGKDYSFEQLKNAGVNIEGVEIEGNKKSDEFFIEEFDKGRERSFRSMGEMSGEVSLTKKRPILSRAKWIHLATAPPDQQLKWLEEIKEMNLGEVKISADSFELFAQNEPIRVKKVIEKCDLFFANEREYEMLGKRRGVELILKKGARGASWLGESGDEIVRIEANRVSKVVDTTGAGEVLAGVVLGLMVNRKMDKRMALESGVMMASSSVEKYSIEHIINNWKNLKIN